MLDALSDDGTQRDAQWHSFGVNATHGLPRTREDVARILRTIFEDEKWAKTPLSKIVAHTSIPQSTVHDHRQRILSGSGKYDSGKREFIHPKTGKTSVMNTANIGRPWPPARGELALKLEPLIAARAKKNQQAAGGALFQKSGKAPIHTDKELARIAGVSHDTIRKVKLVVECEGEETHVGGC